MPNDGKEIQIEARDDEIIVDLDDLAGIQEVLDSSRVSWERIEKDTRLRLALVTLGLKTLIEWKNAAARAADTVMKPV